MKKLSLLFAGALAICLLLTGVVPVHAAEEEQDSPLRFEDISPDELDELDKLDLVPVDSPDRRVKISGGFKGAWVTDNTPTDNRPGSVAGIYGTATYQNGISYGFFGGLWQDASGRMAGYLKGRYEAGQFRGIWRCLETGMGGSVIGRYTPAPDATTDAMYYHFYGRWATRDGQLSGFLKGTWSPLSQVQPVGKFAGQWVYPDQLTAASIRPDGKLSGSYGVAVFRDGTRIQYFGGTWESRRPGEGRLGGLIVGGRFCGLWNSDNSNQRGYLKGAWRSNRFKGIWGHFTSNIEGRLWGTYRPLLSPSTVEREPLPDQSATLTPALK